MNPVSKSSPSPPPEPDPGAIASAQGAANKETAIAQARLNQVNEITPFGSSTYSPTGQSVDGIQQFQRTTVLDPAQQAILDKQNAVSLGLGDLSEDQLARISASVATPFDYAGMPAAPVADEASRKAAEDAIYGRYASRLDPQFKEREDQLATTLANQGIGIGSEAYKNEYDRLGRERTDAYQAAREAAVGAGGAEQSRMFGLGATARDRAIQEELTKRGMPLNELAAMMGTSPGLTAPTFSPTPQTQIAPTDVTGAYALSQSAANNAYNQQMGRNNAAMGGLYGLGAAGLGGAAYNGFGFGRR